MVQSRMSYPTNRKEVYKFWLGFVEKLTLVIITVAILPNMSGQLNYGFRLLVVWASAIFILAGSMAYLSRRLWYLPKDNDKLQEREVKNE